MHYILLALFLLFSGTASAQKIDDTSPSGYIQRGKASFYSRRATGARTASGERLHHDSLTCAHRTHPFGTLLVVKNLNNDKEVIVRVTDRGPFGRGRIVDLSYAAAKQLGMIAQGVVDVEVRMYANDGVPFLPEDEDYVPSLPIPDGEGSMDWQIKF